MYKHFWNALAFFILWVALFMLCGFVAQAWQQNKEAKCFQFEDRQQRYACLRRV